jgi:hypothetical protein
MFFIFTKGPFGSLWGIRTEVARVYIPTMSKARRRRRRRRKTDRWQNRIDAVATASC